MKFGVIFVLFLVIGCLYFFAASAVVQSNNNQNNTVKEIQNQIRNRSVAKTTPENRQSKPKNGKQ